MGLCFPLLRLPCMVFPVGKTNSNFFFLKSCREKKQISFCSSFPLIAWVSWRKKKLLLFSSRAGYLFISSTENQGKKKMSIQTIAFLPEANISSSLLFLYNCEYVLNPNKNIRHSRAWDRKRYLNTSHPTSHVVFADHLNALY